MALFTDRQTAGIEDLKKYESAVLELTSAEGIDVNVKLQLAHEEIGLELCSFLQRSATGIHSSGYPLSTVVMTEGLRHWYMLHSLSVLYRDLYSNQLNDRYLAKWREYEKLARLASDRLFEYGVGVVATPIASGGRPTLSGVSAPGAPGGTYYAAVTWVDARGSEGSPGDVANIELPADQTVTVQPGIAPVNGLLWNVYAGPFPSELTLQNSDPLPASDMWTLPTAGLIAGRAAGSGQSADFVIRHNRVLQRG